jgi:hypothetical protein
MRLETKTLAEATSTILLHNVADAGGKRVLKKGTWLRQGPQAQRRRPGAAAPAVGRPAWTARDRRAGTGRVFDGRGAGGEYDLAGWGIAHHRGIES